MEYRSLFDTTDILNEMDTTSTYPSQQNNTQSLPPPPQPQMTNTYSNQTTVAAQYQMNNPNATPTTATTTSNTTSTMAPISNQNQMYPPPPSQQQYQYQQNQYYPTQQNMSSGGVGMVKPNYQPPPPQSAPNTMVPPNNYNMTPNKYVQNQPPTQNAWSNSYQSSPNVQQYKQQQQQQVMMSPMQQQTQQQYKPPGVPSGPQPQQMNPAYNQYNQPNNKPQAINSYPAQTPTSYSTMPNTPMQNGVSGPMMNKTSVGPQMMQQQQPPPPAPNNLQPYSTNQQMVQQPNMMIHSNQPANPNQYPTMNQYQNGQQQNKMQPQQPIQTINQQPSYNTNNMIVNGSNVGMGNRMPVPVPVTQTQYSPSVQVTTNQTNKPLIQTGQNNQPVLVNNQFNVNNNNLNSGSQLSPNRPPTISQQQQQQQPQPGGVLPPNYYNQQPTTTNNYSTNPTQSSYPSTTTTYSTTYTTNQQPPPSNGSVAPYQTNNSYQMNRMGPNVVGQTNYNMYTPANNNMMQNTQILSPSISTTTPTPVAAPVVNETTPTKKGRGKTANKLNESSPDTTNEESPKTKAKRAPKNSAKKNQQEQPEAIIQPASSYPMVAGNLLPQQQQQTPASASISPAPLNRTPLPQTANNLYAQPPNQMNQPHLIPTNNTSCISPSSSNYAIQSTPGYPSSYPTVSTYSANYSNNTSTNNITTTTNNNNNITSNNNNTLVNQPNNINQLNSNNNLQYSNYPNQIKQPLLPPQPINIQPNQQQQLNTFTINSNQTAQVTPTQIITIVPQTNQQTVMPSQNLTQTTTYSINNPSTAIYQQQQQQQQPIQPLQNNNNQLNVNNENNSYGLTSFMDKQQQIISENLNTFNQQPVSTIAVAPPPPLPSQSANNLEQPNNVNISPGKKLTKKQLKALANGEPLPEKKQRKLKPKKGSSLENSLNDSTTLNNSQQDENNTNGLSASTKSKIDATIDDFMKEYKLKKKKKKQKNEGEEEEEEKSESESEEDDGEESDEDDADKINKLNDQNDPSFLENNNSPNESEDELNKNAKVKKVSKTKKSKKIRDLAQESELNELDSTNNVENGDSVKKKRRYTKKKVNLQLDNEQSNTLDNQDPNSNTVKFMIGGAEDSLSMTPGGNETESINVKKSRKKQAAKETPNASALNSSVFGSESNLSTIITPNRSGVGRRKSTANLVKLLGKKAKKKRKKTSSGEEEEEDDDSDDFELTLSKPKKETLNKTTNGGENQNGETVDGTENGNNDEEAAKLLQASESRRSTRAKISKKSKYNDDGIKDEDLLMPVTEADNQIEVDNGENNSTLVLQDNFIVDKILGIKMGKRKTKRKVIKDKTKPKVKKDEEKIMGEVKTEDNASTNNNVNNNNDSKQEQESIQHNEETKIENKDEDTKEEIKQENKETNEGKNHVEDDIQPSNEIKACEESKDIENKMDVSNSEKNVENASNTAQEPVIETTENQIKENDTDSVQLKEDEPSNKDDKLETEENQIKQDVSIENDKPKEVEIEKMEVECSTEKTETVLTEAKVEEKKLDVIEDKKPEVVDDKKPEVVEEEEQDDEEDDVSEYEEDGGEIEVEEFFVKYKNLSYLHCEWRTRDELFISDKRIDQKIKRFKLKKQQTQYMFEDEWQTENEKNGYNNEDDELFNSDYVIIDRILDMNILDDPQKPGEKQIYYLIKWKSLPYDEASWELEQDVKNQKKIDRYHEINRIVPEWHLKHLQRPKSDKWQPMNESRTYKNGNKLREYQVEGISWLSFCWLNGRNCILADEMGLGKTVQSITFLQEVANYGVRGPWLILVPLSTIGNWIREFETWTDFNVFVYHGSAVSRQMIQDYEFYFRESPENNEYIAKSPNKNIVKFNAIITTYEVLLSDVTIFCQFKWRNVIIDEAHRLKNKNCKLIEGLRFMDVEHKVLLTGTPLQNNIEELFSLLNFLEPQQFHSSQEFLQEFGDLKTDTQVNKLQAILKPMMLRRLKEDVEKNLAPKEETIIEVELTNIQKKYYRAILEKNFQFLSRGSTSTNMPNLMNTMMELRKCCNHPYLTQGAEDHIVGDFIESLKQKEKENFEQMNKDKIHLQAMVQASGKLVLVDKLLPKLKAGGHRVLIFSQMIRVLDILEDYLIQMRFTYERLDGRIRGELRQEAIDRYSKPDSDRFAFLICTKAGGLGINLTAADTVIIYDSDWNPQNDLQAQARVHRIGQRKSVKIYRLITRNTYEREMFDKASLKLGLDKAVLQSMRNQDKFKETQSNNSMQLSKKEIEDLLKKGAYGAIMEDDNAADKFCEEDIDKILQQRSTVIQIEGGEKGSTFSKASFQTSETNDISIDDPEFWQKWAKKADIDVEEKLNPKDERIIYEPRRRTQTRRYGGPDEFEESEYSSSDTDENNPNNNNQQPGVGTRGRKSKRGKHKKGKDDDEDFNQNDNEDEGSNVWSRDDCYKVEKNLLIYGWSRWSKILKHCDFSAKKKGGVQTEQDVESLSRTILAYALKNYNGDEQIKQFMIELIDPSKSNFDELKNHEGLAAPVQRAARSKTTTSSKNNKENAEPNKEETEKESKESKDLNDLEWAKNAEELLGDENYKKHLLRQSNRILLRLRQLFYIKHEIIGDEIAAKLDKEDQDNIDQDNQIAYQDIDLNIPEVTSDLPVEWWDKSCDQCMFIGVYKHGYEKYYLMRSDPKLCFLQLCGPPDAKDELILEQEEQKQEQENEEQATNKNDENSNEKEKVDDKDEIKKEDDDNKDKDDDNKDKDDEKNEKEEQKAETDENNKKENDEEKDNEKEAINTATSNSNHKIFPSVSELNNRLRKLIVCVQKYRKQEAAQSKRNQERQEKRLSKLASTQERAQARQMEKQAKWSKREEQNFYRAISSFGIDCLDKSSNLFAWDRFKEIAQLDKKLDETLTDYYNLFYYMCKKVCNKLTPEELDNPPPNNPEVQIEQISEDRASRCIQRVEFLNKVRIDVLKHDKFEEWVSDKCLPSNDLPDWWIPGKHDVELVKAAARYGIIRTEYYYANDPDFTFKESLTKYMRHIERLMDQDNELIEDPNNKLLDPMQYYFQNQAKIQFTFKQILDKERMKQAALKKDKPEVSSVKEEEKQVEDKQEKCKDSNTVTPEEEPKEKEDVKPLETENKEELTENLNKEEASEIEKDQVGDENEEKEVKMECEITTEEKIENKKDNEIVIENKTENEDQQEKEVSEEDKKDEKSEDPEKQSENMEVENKLSQEKPTETKVEEEHDNTENEVKNEIEDKTVTDEINEKEADNDKLEKSKDENENEKEIITEATVEEKVEIKESTENKNEDVIIEEEIEKEPTNYFGLNTIPVILWPKDRVIMTRLENIIQMFENNGEWPQKPQFLFPPVQQPQPSTPLSCNNPLNVSNLITPSALLLSEQRKQMMSPMLMDSNSLDGNDTNDDYDQNEHDDQNTSKYSKPKRGRPPKLDLPQLASSMGVSASSASVMPADPAHKIRNLLNGKDSPVSNEYKNSRLRNSSHLTINEDSESNDNQDISFKSNKKDGFLEPGEILRPKSTRTSLRNKEPLSPSDLVQQDMDSSFGFKPNKNNSNSKNRKSISTGNNDSDSNNSLAALGFDSSSLASLFLSKGQDPNERITMLNIETGQRIVGSKAPKRIDLPIWLLNNPNFIPEDQDILQAIIKNTQLNQQPESSNNDSNNHQKRKSQLPVKNEQHNDEQQNEETIKPHSSTSSASSSNPNDLSQLVLVNKITNKKLTAPKIPSNWKSLCSFLEKNENYFIEPSCNEFVKSKFGKFSNMPDIIKSRMILKQPANKPNEREHQPSKSSSSNQSKNSTSNMNNNNNNNSNNNSKTNKASSSSSNNTMFNPFSPNSNAQMQGLSELLAAAGNSGGVGNADPLASLMAALAAGGGVNQPGLPPPFGNQNPFLLPPPFGAPSSNDSSSLSQLPPAVLAEFIKQMPPGFDISQFEELTNSLASLQHQHQQKTSHDNKSTSNNNHSNNNNNNSNNDKKNKDKQSSNESQRKENIKDNLRNNNKTQESPNNNNKSSSNMNKSNSNNMNKSQHQTNNKSSSSNQQQQSKNQTNSNNNNNNRDQKRESSSNNKQSSANNNSNNNNLGGMDKNLEELAAAMQMDPSNPNFANALASMMEQEKFMQDMMSLAAMQNNPFLPFGNNSNPLAAALAAGFAPPPPPPIPTVPSFSNKSSSSKSRHQQRSPSPNNRSASPASSVASNMSTKHQKQHHQQQQQQQNQASQLPGGLAGADFNLLMNLMGAAQLPGANPFGLPSAAGLAGLPPGLAGLPPELLAASAAGLDPSLFSALAQLNNLSNNMNDLDNISHKNPSSKVQSKQSNNSSSSSSNPLKRPRPNDDDGGLDLTMKRSSQPHKKPSNR